MLHFLPAAAPTAAPDPLRWELTELARGGPCRLAVHHTQGVIVEYHSSPTIAILRLQELEQRLAPDSELEDQEPAGLPS